MPDLQVVDFIHDDPPFDAWSFIRDVLSRGAAIEAGNLELTYERFSAKLDAAARELADRLKPHLRATEGAK